MNKIPIIETQHLRLRAWTENDLHALCKLYTNADFMRYIGSGQTRTIEETWNTLSILAGHWLLRGFGMWAVETKLNAEFVGIVGLKQPYAWPGIEIGWGIGPRYWGKGHGVEAARAAMHWGFSSLDIEALISVIAPDNSASQKLAKKLGSCYFKTQIVSGKQEHIYRITRIEYEALL